MFGTIRNLALGIVVAVAVSSTAQASVILNTTGNLRFTDAKDIQGKHFHLHSVMLHAGKKYVIDMNSMHFDTFIRLKSPAGNVVAANDDSGPALNARIMFTAPATGMYRIVATSFSAGATGSYQLRATETVVPGGVVVMNVQGDLRFSDPSVGGKHQKVYNVMLHAGRSYVINMHSPHFDTFLKLKRSGLVLAQNDDGGPGRDSRIVFTPMMTGMFQVVATSYSAGATGHFSVNVRD